MRRNKILVTIGLEGLTTLYVLKVAMMERFDCTQASFIYNNNSSLFVIYSTFVCPTEIIAFSDRIEEFRAINTEVVGCSVDSVFTHLAWYVHPKF